MFPTLAESFSKAKWQRNKHEERAPPQKKQKKPVRQKVDWIKTLGTKRQAIACNYFVCIYTIGPFGW